MASGETVAVAKRALAGGGTAWATTETVFVRADSITSPAVAYLPGSSKLAGRAFAVKAIMAVTGGVTTNFTGAIYFGTSTTVASNVKIATSAATNYNAAASGSVLLEADCSWDEVSKIIQGVYYGHDNNTSVAQAGLSVAATAANPATEGLGFVCTGLFSVSNATNVATLRELTIEVI